MWLGGCGFEPPSNPRPSLSRTLTCTYGSLGTLPPSSRVADVRGEIVAIYISPYRRGQLNVLADPSDTSTNAIMWMCLLPKEGGEIRARRLARHVNGLDRDTCLGKCGRPRQSTPLPNSQAYSKTWNSLHLLSPEEIVLRKTKLKKRGLYHVDSISIYR